MTELAAASYAYQQQLEQWRRLKGEDSDRDAMLEEDLAKARQAVEVIWLKTTASLPQVP